MANLNLQSVFFVVSRLTAMLAVAMIAACSDIPQEFQLSADPLADAPGTPKAFSHTKDETGHIAAVAAVDDPTITRLDQVHFLVQDSQEKCTRFVNSLYAQTAATGTFLDSASTLTSALATVFKPISVTHSLAAASTWLSGTRTAISTEYLNSLAISHVAQAIQSTYGTKMQQYIAYLDSVDPSKIDVFAERSTIASYHGLCSLASAEGSITSALQPGAQSKSITVSYPLPASPTLASVVAGVIAAVNSNADFKANGITASSPSAGIVSFAMTTPFPLTASVSPAGAHTTATMASGTPQTLAIGGTLTAKDTIVISGVPPASSSGSNASSDAKPTAGVPGSSPQSQ